jgi:WhiB family redox-sensing transcriptional regulator
MRSPGFDLDDTRFRQFAACTEDQQSLFFPEDGTAEWCYARARQICHGCAVRMECLEFALACGERHGMWGGCTPSERERIRSTRRRAAAELPAIDLRPDPAARRRPSMEQLIVALAERNGMPTFPVRRATHAEMTGAHQ